MGRMDLTIDKIMKAGDYQDYQDRSQRRLSFGFVEDLYVNGLTLSQLDNLLTKHIKKYLRKPRLDVIVKEYNSKSITLLGAIQYRSEGNTGPGKYTLRGKTALLEIRAGGLGLAARDVGNHNGAAERVRRNLAACDVGACRLRGRYDWWCAGADLIALRVARRAQKHANQSKQQSSSA